MLCIDIEGRVLTDRPADVPTELGYVIAGLVRTAKRIRRIECRVIAAGEDLAVKFVGARLGEDLDAPIAQLVVFGGKGILVDANFANGFFGRKLAGRKAVDIKLSAVGAGGWSSQRL